MDIESIPKLFDRISHKYDRANRILSFGMDMHWRRSLAKYIPSPHTPVALLDLATGTGDQIAALFETDMQIDHAIGIDLSQGMLQIAQKKFQKKKYGHLVDFQKANAEELPFLNERFDLCTFSFGIRNVSNPLLALSEMHRVTKKEGRCLILEFTPPRGWFRTPYLLYLRHFIPYLGGKITKEPKAYQYLNRSIEQYASPELFLSWMKQTGWKNPTASPLLFGSVMLYRADA